MTLRRGLYWLALASLLASGCDRTLSFDAPADVPGGASGFVGVAGTAGAGFGGSFFGGSGGRSEPWERAGGTGFGEEEEECFVFCASVGQRCDLNELRCVECFEDEDCEPLGLFCDRGVNRCVACVGDRGCPGGQWCDGLTNQCLYQCNEAQPDSGCRDSTPICRGGVCAACHDDDDCAASPERPYCLESGARCAECEGDFHCPNDERCDPVLFECVKCADSRDCELPMVCDPEAHECFNPYLGQEYPI